MTDQELARNVEAAAAALTEAIRDAKLAGLSVVIDTSLSMTDCDQPDIGPMPLIQALVSRPITPSPA